MATAKLFNRVRVATATTGTGTVTLGSAVAGYASFAESGVVNNDVVTYCIEDGDDFEIGRGTYSSSGPTLSRDTVLLSKIAGAAGTSKINLSGTAQVFLTSAKEDFVPAASNLSISTPIHGMDMPINLGIAASVASNALTIAVKGADGNDPNAINPVLIPFRSATAATGTPVWRSLTAALSLTVSSGSTLGTSNGVACRVWVVLFDDAGTLRLGVVNCSNSTNIFTLDEQVLASSTAEGGAGGADSAGVFYTDSAVASKAYRILGYVTFNTGQATAGTWASSPSVVHLFGTGAKKPGDVVQTKTVQGGSVTTTTSSTAQNTNSTVSFTLTRAANLVRFQVNGYGRQNSSNDVVITSLYRDSTILGGDYNNWVGVSADARLACCMTWIDKPNSTSAITYQAKVRNSAGSASVQWQPIHLEIAEIMG